MANAPDPDDYDVEKVVNKRQKNGRIQYKVKWLDFSPSQNGWVFASDCKCDTKIAEFESNNIIGIIGCTKTHRGIKYAAVQKAKNSFVLMSSIEIVQECPTALFDFLQSHIEFSQPTNVAEADDVVNSLPPIGDPKLLGITNLNNVLKYWFEYDSGSEQKPREILTAGQMKAKLDTHLASMVNYLEDKMVFVGGPPEEKIFQLTVAMKKKMSEMDVDTNVKIVVPRIAGLERYLLERAASNRRLNRLSLPIRNIPFGVRGARRIRNRRFTAIMFIGTNPNPDNMVLQPNQPPSYASPQPARRSVYRQLTFTPSPPRNVVNSPPAAEDTMVDFSFDDAFGRLSIESD